MATSLSDVPGDSIRIDTRWSGSDSLLEDGGYRFYLTAEVPKSEAEIQADKDNLARAKARELELFNRLKAKFEGAKSDGNRTAL